MAESKVQKVAKRKAHEKTDMLNTLGACQCGGQLQWAKVVDRGMRKVCMSCGSIQ